MHKTNHGAAAGFIIRNENGNHVIADAQCLGDNTISIAESLALRDAIWIARSRGFRKIRVEGDSKLVIDTIVPWRLKSIMDDNKRLAGSFDEIV